MFKRINMFNFHLTLSNYFVTMFFDLLYIMNFISKLHETVGPSYLDVQIGEPITLISFLSGSVLSVLKFRSYFKVQLCSMKQGTVSPWSTAPLCFRVLQVFPTMSDSSDCESWENSRTPRHVALARCSRGRV